MHRLRLGFLVALVVFALDQLVKWSVTGPLGINQIGDQLVLLPFFNFTYTQNNGISLGLLNATTPVGRWMLVALTSRDRHRRRRLDGPREEPRRPDRARDGARRRARQHPRPRALTAMSSTSPTFISATCGPFLVFNVGDAAISIAVVILLLRAFLSRKDQRKGH